MEQIKLEAQIREEKGSGPVGRLRQSGFIPAIVYKDGEAMSIKISRKDLMKALHTSKGENVIVNLAIAPGSAEVSAGRQDTRPKTRTAIVKDVQHDPIKDDILHVDFQEISLTETLKVNVTIASKGEAVGVKQDGGVLQHIMWQVEVECLPTQIPEKLEVDVTNLKIGDSVSVKDLIVPKGIKVLTDPELRVMSVEPPMKEEALEVAAPAEGAEPEVLKEKKEVPEEGEGAGASPKGTAEAKPAAEKAEAPKKEEKPAK